MPNVEGKGSPLVGRPVETEGWNSPPPGDVREKSALTIRRARHYHAAPELLGEASC